MKIAVVGASGMVGGTILKVLGERNFPVSELIPVASEKSIGKTILFQDKEYKIVSAKEAIKRNPAIVIFSAGGEASIELAPQFANNGTFVIDNSSAWRNDPDKKLIIPEINKSEITENDLIIANPNCSTIQMLVVVAPIHLKFGVKRITVSTYQSVSGSGYKAVQNLKSEQSGDFSTQFYPHPIYNNCIPQCDSFTQNGYTKEEMKMVNETHKILDPTIEVCPSCVRVPVDISHSETISLELNREFEINEIFNVFENSDGVVVLDKPEASIYPTALNCAGKDEVFVGRIRKDLFNPKVLNFWVVADNLRKGAATNAVQIAEYISSKFIR